MPSARFGEGPADPAAQGYSAGRVVFSSGQRPGCRDPTRGAGGQRLRSEISKVAPLMNRRWLQLRPHSAAMPGTPPRRLKSRKARKCSLPEASSAVRFTRPGRFLGIGTRKSTTRMRLARRPSSRSTGPRATEGISCRASTIVAVSKERSGRLDKADAASPRTKETFCTAARRRRDSANSTMAGDNSRPTTEPAFSAARKARLPVPHPTSRTRSPDVTKPATTRWSLVSDGSRNLAYSAPS